MTTIIAGIQKEIKYDRLTKDFSCYISIDGDPAQYIGSAQTRSEAEQKCNSFAFEYLMDTQTVELAAQLLAA